LALSYERHRQLMEQLLKDLPTMADDDRLEHYEICSEQVSGLRSDVSARDHRFSVDEPSDWGTDTAANPAELALAALASSLEVTARIHAAQLEIPVGRITTNLSADLDVAAFAGTVETRPGFERVRVLLTIELDSQVAAVSLHQLERAVDTRCPMLDVFRSPIAVDLIVETVSVRDGSDQVS
jgi:uncharacterized OsmC-like protein